MIEEIIGFIVSFATLLKSAPPLSSRKRNADLTDEVTERIWNGKIHREYEQVNGSIRSETTLLNHAMVLPDSDVSVDVRFKPSLCQSLHRSLRASLLILFAVFPCGIFAPALIYVDLNTTDLCFEWEQLNYSIPYSIMRWRLVGDQIQAIILNFWFAATLVLLFGWRRFRGNYMSTVYVGFATGVAVVIYQSFLFIFGVSHIKNVYRYPGNALFLVGVIWGSILVADRIRSAQPLVTCSKFEITVIISFSFTAGFAISVAYKYAIVPYFNELKNVAYKAIVAAIAPLVALLPIGISRYFALRRTSDIIEPDRSFILVYFLSGAVISQYRIMQADFTNIWLFVALSLLHGVSNVAGKATGKLRSKIWKRFIKFLRNTSCFQKLDEINYDTPHHRRLKADLEIQDMLFQFTTLISSQAYIVLYPLTSFDNPVWPILKESLFRIAIGLGIDFIFNIISIFVQIHWYDIPIPRVWLKHWKRHMLANAIILITTVTYFTQVHLSVFQTREDSSHVQHFHVRNCTLPFTTG